VGESILHLCLLNSSAIHANLAKRLLHYFPKLINDIYLSEEYYGKLLSSIFYLLSSIFYLLSSIFYLISYILYLISYILYLLTSILYLISSIFSFLLTLFNDRGTGLYDTNVNLP